MHAKYTHLPCPNFFRLLPMKFTYFIPQFYIVFHRNWAWSSFTQYYQAYFTKVNSHTSFVYILKGSYIIVFLFLNITSNNISIHCRCCYWVNTWTLEIYTLEYNYIQKIALVLLKNKWTHDHLVLYQSISLTIQKLVNNFSVHGIWNVPKVLPYINASWKLCIFLLFQVKGFNCSIIKIHFCSSYYLISWRPLSSIKIFIFTSCWDFECHRIKNYILIPE